MHLYRGKQQLAMCQNQPIFSSVGNWALINQDKEGSFGSPQVDVFEITAVWIKMDV